jgi:hypothetical protein
MAREHIKVDDNAIAGVALNKAEKRLQKRQERKLRKFNIVDESKVKGIAKWIYLYQKRRRIRKRKREAAVLRGTSDCFCCCLSSVLSALTR